VTPTNTPHLPFRVAPIAVPSAREGRWPRRHTNRNLYAEKPERFEPTSAVDWSG
jgi:hypothetical protein